MARSLLRIYVLLTLNFRQVIRPNWITKVLNDRFCRLGEHIICDFGSYSGLDFIRIGTLMRNPDTLEYSDIIFGGIHAP